MNNHDRQITGFLLEHPEAMAQVDRLGARYGGDLALHLVTQEDVDRDPQLVAVNDILAWDRSGSGDIYVIRPDGSFREYPADPE